MEIKAKLNYLRISPRKVRLITDLIKGLDLAQAEQQLRFCPKRGARPILKLLQSAVANAKHNFNLTRENLYVLNIRVDQGPALKRWRARAMGRAASILKRTSRLSLVLGVKDLAKIVKKKAATKSTKDFTDKSDRPLTLPRREKVMAPEKKDQDLTKKEKHPWLAEKLRQQKRGFYIGDKFKGAAKRMFRRKSI